MIRARMQQRLQAQGRTAERQPAACALSGTLRRAIVVRKRRARLFSPTISVKTGLGFDQVGWTAIVVGNPDDQPPACRVCSLETPANPLGILVGFAAIVRIGDHVCALGSQNPVKTHPIFAARWRAEQLRRGDFSNPEWLAGNRLGWVPHTSSVPRWPVLENAQAEITLQPGRSHRPFPGRSGLKSSGVDPSLGDILETLAGNGVRRILTRWQGRTSGE